jgi:hypothetical protein
LKINKLIALENVLRKKLMHKIYFLMHFIIKETLMIINVIKPVMTAIILITIGAFHKVIDYIFIIIKT